MIFDIKMDSRFTCKSRLVAGRHKTETPLSATYSSVVTRESVRLEFVIYGMDNMDFCACNIGKA